MDQTADTARFTVEDTEWELRVSPPTRYRTSVGVDWEIEQTSGEERILGHRVALETGEGRVAIATRPIRTGSGGFTDGTLIGNLGGAGSISVVVELFNDARSQVAEITLNVPSDDTPTLEQRESPIPIPVWANPPGVDSVVTPAGEQGAWVEMVIESFEAAPIEGGVEWTAVVRGESINGGEGEVVRRLNVRRAYPDRRTVPRDADVAEIDLRVGVGDEKTVEGELEIDEGEVIAYLSRGLDEADTGTGTWERLEYDPGMAELGDDWFDDLEVVNLWETEPLETVDVPYPADETTVRLIANTPSLIEWATRGHMDGLDYGFRTTRAVGDREFQAAVLAWREDLIDDEQMAAIHALFATEASGDVLDRSGSDNEPFIVGALDDEPGVIRLSIARDRTGSLPPNHPPVYGYGPGVEFDDDFTTAEDGNVAISDCVPEEEYTFTTDRQQYESNIPYTATRAGEVLSKARVSAGVVTPDPIPEPDPPEDDDDPDPDPDPVEPSVDAACDFDGAEINVGGSVTIPVDVTAGDGDTDTDATVEIEVAGQTASETVTLEPNGSARVEATYEISDPGEYTPTITLS